MELAFTSPVVISRVVSWEISGNFRRNFSGNYRKNSITFPEFFRDKIPGKITKCPMYSLSSYYVEVCQRSDFLVSSHFVA